MNRQILLVILSFSFLLIFIWGCGELEKGTFPTNVPPQVYLVNIPQEDASFSINPRVYWWGTDADGRIVEYQYLVIPECKINEEGDTVDLGLIKKDANGLIREDFVKFIEGISSTEWVDTLIAKRFNEAGYHAHRDSLIAVIDTQTSVNIVMFAELDTTIYVSQYFFVRGVDNDRVGSKIWKPETGHVFRRLARNNHPPDTHIDTINFAKRGTYYSLPETTETWHGIKIQWEGSDSSDYPVRQPDFYYKWEFFGPFEDTASVNLSAIIDSSWDSVANTRWVLETSHIFINLKNYDEATGGNQGWYLFRVASRDDAFVEDETPDHVFIHVVHPLFTFWPANQNQVLLIDASKYVGGKSYGFVKHTDDQPGRDKVLSIYEKLMSEVQKETGIVYDFWLDESSDPKSAHLPPDEILLSDYQLVIVLNHGRLCGIDGQDAALPEGLVPIDSGYVQYKNYLDVGGKVWFVGVNNWDLPVGGWSNVNAADRNSGFSYRYMVTNLAKSYFSIAQAFYPDWGISNRTEEFIAARPFPGTGFPILESDSVKVDTILEWRRTTPPIVTPIANAIPLSYGVVISPTTELIYNFVSLYGLDSKLNGRPCGYRFTGPTFKTAEFCFPLYLINDEQAVEAMKLMVNWFLKPTVP